MNSILITVVVLVVIVMAVILSQREHLLPSPLTREIKNACVDGLKEVAKKNDVSAEKLQGFINTGRGMTIITRLTPQELLSEDTDADFICLYMTRTNGKKKYTTLSCNKGVLRVVKESNNFVDTFEALKADRSLKTGDYLVFFIEYIPQSFP